MSTQRPNRTALFVVLGIATVALISSIAVVFALISSNRPSLDEPSVLEIALDGGYADGFVDDPLAELGLGNSRSSLYDIVRAIDHAATDDHVAGLLLTIRSPSLGFAQQQEIGQAVDRLRDAGKPVFAHIETDLVSNGRYLLATHADELWTTPQAMWLVQGLQADVEFYRGTLDKLNIEPDVIMFKEYKSAGETFLNKQMSEPMREALTTVLEDVQRMWIERVAERRGLSTEAVRAFVDAGALTSTAAKEAGLIDAFGYRDQVQDAMVDELSLDEWTRVKLSRYLETLPGPETDDRIALVFGEGPIVASEVDEGNPFVDTSMISGPKLARDIRKAAKADRVKAIVLRVNSPGGSAVGSDLVWREIERAQEKGKPVIVSMASVAGSGGYWISMGADAIVAQPSTITGSIGVVFQKLNLRGMYEEWLGASVDSVSFAANSNLMSPYHSLDEEQYATLQGVIGGTYADFVTKVADGRGMTFDEVEPLAHGRIWTGEDALERKLVDQLGGLSVAISLATDKAGIDADTDVEVFPKSKSVWERFAEGDLSVSIPHEPTSTEIEAWLQKLAEPRAEVKMPSIRIY